VVRSNDTQNKKIKVKQGDIKGIRNRQGTKIVIIVEKKQLNNAKDNQDISTGKKIIKAMKKGERSSKK